MRGTSQSFTEEFAVSFSPELITSPSSSSPATDKWADKIEAEQVNLLYAQAPPGFLATIVNAGIVTFVLWNVVAPLTLLAWCTAITIIASLRLILVRSYQRTPETSKQTQLWRTRFIIGTGLNGVAWGSAGILLFPPHSLAHQVFLTFVLGGMIVGASAVLFPVLSAYWAFLLPTGLPMVAHLFFQGDTLSVTMGLLIVCCVSVFMLAARHTHASITESIRLRFENLDLVHSLSTAKEQTEAANHALQIEIVERQRAEEQIKTSLQEKEVLLKEIHHRVKNNLQIISSLLNLQSRVIANPEALTVFKESQNRVRSMALIHEKLYQSKDLAKIDFEAYARELTNYLFRAYHNGAAPVTLNVNVSNVFLNIETAVPCGLIVSELVSNALKYAFPDGRAGEINIDLYPSSNNIYTLIVADNGVGLPPAVDLRQVATLGFRIVQTLTDQLGGTITLPNAGGATFIITLPIKEKDENGEYGASPHLDR